MLQNYAVSLFVLKNGYVYFEVLLTGFIFRILSQREITFIVC
jgi:hypothetical protein